MSASTDTSLIVTNPIDNIPVDNPNRRGNPNWVKGGKSPNPGGRPKALREIERMLTKEHRNVDRMREVFERLRNLAMGEVEIIPVLAPDGSTIKLEAKLTADPAFMKLYLDRLLGPAVPFEEPLDLSDAAPETIEYLKVKFQRRG